MAASGSQTALGSYALKHDHTFAVADPFGDMHGSADGLFHRDTRILSRFVLTVGGEAPALLSSGLSDDNVFFRANLTNRPLPQLGESKTMPQGAIHIERSRLIPMFQALTFAEQTDERAKSGFGNGEGCFTCHGQFSLHAQLYVKFDSSGMWQSAATGLQDPMGELGRSLNGLMASHLSDPATAQLETSQMFGKPVNNLADAAKVVASSPTFDECVAHRFLDYTLGLTFGTIVYDAHLFPAIAEEARKVQADPTFSQIIQALFANPVVVHSVISSLTGEQQ